MPDTLSGILIIALPGRILTGLRVLLKSLFPFVQIDQTEDILSAMQILSVGRQMLVLIDADLPDDEGWRIGAEIQKKCPQHQSVILAHDIHQKDRAYEANLKVLLLEGMTASRLSDALRAHWRA